MKEYLYGSYSSNDDHILTRTGVAHWWFAWYVVKKVTSSNHTWAYLCPMLAGFFWAPRGIVVAWMDPWTPCHASTSPVPSCRFPWYKKNDDHILEYIVKQQIVVNLKNMFCFSNYIYLDYKSLHLESMNPTINYVSHP